MLTKGWKAPKDKNLAVYRGVKKISVDAHVRAYDIGPHTVYCYYPKEVVRVTEPKDGRVVVFLDGLGIEGQQPKAEAAAVQAKGIGQVTEVIMDKMVYRAASHGEFKRWQTLLGGSGMR